MVTPAKPGSPASTMPSSSLSSHSEPATVRGTGACIAEIDAQAGVAAGNGDSPLVAGGNRVAVGAGEIVAGGRRVDADDVVAIGQAGELVVAAGTGGEGAENGVAGLDSAVAVAVSVQADSDPADARLAGVLGAIAVQVVEDAVADGGGEAVAEMGAAGRRGEIDDVELAGEWPRAWCRNSWRARRPRRRCGECSHCCCPAPRQRKNRRWRRWSLSQSRCGWRPAVPR